MVKTQTDKEIVKDIPVTYGSRIARTKPKDSLNSFVVLNDSL